MESSGRGEFGLRFSALLHLHHPTIASRVRARTHTCLPITPSRAALNGDGLGQFLLAHGYCGGHEHAGSEPNVPLAATVSH